MLPVVPLVGRQAVEDCPAAGAPQEALPRFALVQALDAHRQRFHLVLELIEVHDDELTTAVHLLLIQQQKNLQCRLCPWGWQREYSARQPDAKTASAGTSFLPSLLLCFSAGRGRRKWGERRGGRGTTASMSVLQERP